MDRRTLLRNAALIGTFSIAGCSSLRSHTASPREELLQVLNSHEEILPQEDFEITVTTTEQEIFSFNSASQQRSYTRIETDEQLIEWYSKEGIEYHRIETVEGELLINEREVITDISNPQLFLSPLRRTIRRIDTITVDTDTFEFEDPNVRGNVVTNNREYIRYAEYTSDTENFSYTVELEEQNIEDPLWI